MPNIFRGYRMFPLMAIHLSALMVFSQTTPVAVHAPICHECISIRVGVPSIEQGPRNDVADANFSEIQLPNGHFRGFTAAGVTYAIDGRQPAEMNGPLRNVLGRGAQGTFDSCGQWIQHTELTGKVVLAWVHDETACNYKAGQTHMSTSLSISKDYGFTWKDMGQIINDNRRDAPKANKETGEGNCTALDGKDGYYYPTASGSWIIRRSYRARRSAIRPRATGRISFKALGASPALAETRRPSRRTQVVRLLDGI